MLTCARADYNETISLARSKVSLAKVGIESIRTRRAITGAMVLEIPGASGLEADKLASSLRDILGNREGVKISRPTKTAEVRVRRLDESIGSKELAEVAARTGECETAEIKVGRFTRMADGLRAVILICPVAAANKLAKAGAVQVGWSRGMTELLPARLLQCYRSHARGHVQAACRETVDRSAQCFRCGETGHSVASCTRQPKCVVCVERGLPAGGPACLLPPKKKRKGGFLSPPAEKGEICLPPRQPRPPWRRGRSWGERRERGR